MADDTAALVVALSAQVSKFEKDMKDAVKVADTNVSAIEKRFSQMNDKIAQEFSGFVRRYAAAAGPLGGVLNTLGPVGLTVAAGIGAATIALGFLTQKTDEYIQKQRDLKEASETTGLSIGQLQLLKTAARESGVEFDKAVAGVSRMAVEIQKLREKGTGPLAESLDKIDPKLTDQVINASSMGEAVDLLSKVLTDASSSFQKAGLAAEIFGKRGLDNLRVLQATLKRGGFAVAPDISDEEKKFNDKLIDLDNQVNSTYKKVNELLGKMFGEQIRQNQLQFWKETKEGLEQAQYAATWFAGFLQQVREYVALKGGVRDTTEAIQNADPVASSSAATRARRPAAATAEITAPVTSSVIVDPYGATRERIDITKQMTTYTVALNEAIQSGLEIKGRDDAALARNLQFLERWAGVLGDAITPQEQLFIQQQKVTEATRQYGDQSAKSIAIQEAGNRATERLIATQTIAANNLRERLLLLSEEEIVQNKLAQVRLDADKAGLKNIDTTKAEIVIRKQAKETIEQQAASLSKLPDATRYAQQALDGFKNADQFLVSFAGNFESAMGDIATGSKTAAEAFKSLADSIIRDLIRITIRMSVTGPLLKGISGLFGEGGGGFGFLMGGGSPSGYGGGKQSGGPVSANVAYTVGEHGKELFVPGQSGMIVPGSFQASQGAGLKVTVNNYTSGQTETTTQQRSGPSGEELIIGIVKKTIASGAADAPNRARFGLRTAKVR